MRGQERISFAGQITGVEGYVESTASGFLAGVELAYSLVLTLPAYPLFRFVHQKLGTY